MSSAQVPQVSPDMRIYGPMKYPLLTSLSIPLSTIINSFYSRAVTCVHEVFSNCDDSFTDCVGTDHYLLTSRLISKYITVLLSPQFGCFKLSINNLLCNEFRNYCSSVPDRVILEFVLKRLITESGSSGSSGSGGPPGRDDDKTNYKRDILDYATRIKIFTTASASQNKITLPNPPKYTTNSSLKKHKLYKVYQDLESSGGIVTLDADIEQLRQQLVTKKLILLSKQKELCTMRNNASGLDAVVECLDRLERGDEDYKTFYGDDFTDVDKHVGVLVEEEEKEETMIEKDEAIVEDHAVVKQDTQQLDLGDDHVVQYTVKPEGGDKELPIMPTTTTLTTPTTPATPTTPYSPPPKRISKLSRPKPTLTMNDHANSASASTNATASGTSVLLSNIRQNKIMTIKTPKNFGFGLLDDNKNVVPRVSTPRDPLLKYINLNDVSVEGNISTLLRALEASKISFLQAERSLNGLKSTEADQLGQVEDLLETVKTYKEERRKRRSEGSSVKNDLSEIKEETTDGVHAVQPSPTVNLQPVQPSLTVNVQQPVQPSPTVHAALPPRPTPPLHTATVLHPLPRPSPATHLPNPIVSPCPASFIRTPPTKPVAPVAAPPSSEVTITSLLIKNLSTSTTHETLRRLVSPYGTVKNVIQGKPGMVYIEFGSYQEVERANVGVRSTVLDGSKIVTWPANPSPRSSPANSKKAQPKPVPTPIKLNHPSPTRTAIASPTPNKMAPSSNPFSNPSPVTTTTAAVASPTPHKANAFLTSPAAEKRKRSDSEILTSRKSPSFSKKMKSSSSSPRGSGGGSPRPFSPRSHSPADNKQMSRMNQSVGSYRFGC
jgi:RNA recognition motif-containing protein